jgi:peptidyl-prolyl cis-trans isomerase B (cyclophilin B)
MPIRILSVKVVHGWLISLLVIGGLLLGSCSSPANPSASTAATSSASVNSTEGVQVENQFANLPRLQGKATVEMIVNGSPIKIEVDGDAAPITAGNFVDLVQRGLYDGLSFHRVVRQPSPFVVQGGDPQSANPNFPANALGTGSFVDPTTSAPRYVPLEIKPQGATEPLYGQTFEAARIAQPPQLTHKRGAVAMARSQAPDSASSQFYFALADLEFLDGSYAVFGYVTEGMEVVDRIQQGDRIESATVLSGAENL